MMARGTLLLALVIALAVGAHAGGKDRIWKGGDSKCYVPGCALCDPNDAKICQVCNNDFVLMADNTCQRAMAPNPKAKFCHGEPPAVANAQGWPKKCKFEKIGTTCMTVCRPGFTSATPVSAYCSVGGVWETTGDCTNQPTPSPTPSPSPSPAPAACQGTPETAENADPFTCSNGQLDDTCDAACAAGFEGNGAIATCTAAGWEVAVDCTAAPTGTCPAAPTADEAADVDSWINAEGGDCADVSTDGTCEGICAEGFEGTPVATCTEDGSWAIEGACTPVAEVNCPGLPEDSPNALAWADCTETGECTGVCADGTDGDTCEGVCTDPQGTDPYIFAVCGLGADGNFGWVVDDNCAGSRRRR